MDRDTAMGEGLVTLWGMRWVDQSKDIHTLPCVKQTAGGELLHSTGSSAQCSVMTWIEGMGWEGGPRGRDIHIYITDSHCCTAETNTAL